jgi:hypothetical protein
MYRQSAKWSIARNDCSCVAVQFGFDGARKTTRDLPSQPMSLFAQRIYPAATFTNFCRHRIRAGFGISGNERENDT